MMPYNQYTGWQPDFDPEPVEPAFVPEPEVEWPEPIEPGSVEFTPAPSQNPAREVIDELQVIAYRIQQDPQFAEVLNREAIVDHIQGAMDSLRVSA